MGSSPKSFLPLLGTLALVSSSSNAHADTLAATYGDSLHERSHTVIAERRGDDVAFRVRREIHNSGKRVEEAELEIRLPLQAVTTSLRTKQGTQWLPGRLVPTAEALGVYEHFTGSGPLASNGPALLAWDDLGAQILRVFPIAANTTITVEYEFLAPTCYHGGKRIAFYPKTEDAKALPAARIRIAGNRGGRVVSQGASLSAKAKESVETCALDASGGELAVVDEIHVLLFDEHIAEPLRVRVGTHRLGSTRSLSALHVEVAPSLGSLPKNAEVVFVLDTSYSQSIDSIKSQIDMVDGYLANLPDARYQIVSAQRTARAVFDSFQPAARARQRLQNLRTNLPARGNGSNLDVAVGLANTLLASDRPGPRRIVAFTDSKLRESLSSELLHAAMAGAPNVLMHVVDVSGYSDGEFERDDEHFLAAAVQATGGMLGTIFPGETRALTKTAMLSLIRPSKLEHVSIETSKAWADAAMLPETLGEGFGLRLMRVFETSPGPVTIKGKIWGRDVVWKAENHAGIAQAIPAMSVGLGVVDELKKDELLEVAMLGQVVSPETSYLARNPELAPSSYNYDEQHMVAHSGRMHGMHSFSSSSCGGAIFGRGNATPTVGEGLDFGAALSGLLEERSVSCSVEHGNPDAMPALEIETTGREIVDVRLPDAASPYAQCVAQAAWELRLGAVFAKHSGRVSVSIQR
jgi:hypothetical protein